MQSERMALFLLPARFSTSSATAFLSFFATIAAASSRLGTSSRRPSEDASFSNTLIILRGCQRYLLNIYHDEFDGTDRRKANQDIDAAVVNVVLAHRGAIAPDKECTFGFVAKNRALLPQAEHK